jgi:hypothetical protein
MNLISSAAPALTAAIKAERRPPTIVADPAQSKDDHESPRLSPGAAVHCRSIHPARLLNCRSFAHSREVPNLILAAAGHKA